MKFHADIVTPVVDLSMRSLCTQPYPGHPKGCPNYGERDTCPPRQKPFDDVYDTDLAIWALWAEFDLGAHIDKMRKAHPCWTHRQLVCCLYWQGTVRKFLRTESAKQIRKFNKDDWSTVKWIDSVDAPFTDRVLLTTCPEAMGVNVTATMKTIGVVLEWPPIETTRMVYLVGVRK